MKPILNVKKIGSTVVFFIDPSTDRPRSIASFEEECPDDLFAFVSTEEGVLHRFGHGYDVRFLERPHVELPTSVRVKATPEELGLVSNQAPQVVQVNAVPLLAPTPTGMEQLLAPNAVPSRRYEIEAMLGKVLKELEFYLVKLSVAEGKKAKALKEEYSVVRAFCVKLYGDVEIEIVALEETYGHNFL